MKTLIAFAVTAGILFTAPVFAAEASAPVAASTPAVKTMHSKHHHKANRKHTTKASAASATAQKAQAKRHARKHHHHHTVK